MWFFKKREKKKAKQLSLEELEKLLSEKAKEKEKEIEKKLEKRIVKLRLALKDAKRHTKELERKKPKDVAIAKIIETSKKQAVIKLNSIIDKLYISSGNVTEILEKAERINQEVESELRNFWKNLALTKLGFEEEMKNIGSSLAKALEEINSLAKEIRESKIDEYTLLKNKLAEIREKKLEIKATMERISELRQKDEDLARKELKIKEKIKALENSQENITLNSLKEKKAELLKKRQELKTEFSRIFGFIDKPLRKYSQLVNSKRIATDKEIEAIVKNLSINPFATFEKTPIKSFENLLNELIKAIENGQIKLKEHEREKKLNALLEIIELKEFYKLRQSIDELNSALASIDRKASEIKINNKLNSFNAELKQNEENKQEIAAEIKNLEREAKELSNEINKLKEEINAKLKTLEENFALELEDD
ncbi:MAG: hypothetical protein J7L14_00140 [Candidatus Diapherotrites archaeon]|nr:hypothetical protein [Candidatus Diapherotrites archaeon]